MDKIKKFLTEHKLIVGIAAAVLLILVPIILGNPYLVRIAIMICIFVILASSLNLIIGFTGMFSLAHAAFYGIGAYTSALLTLRLGFPFLLSLPLAGVVAGILGAFIGLATLRLRETFLVFGTLAFGEIVRIVIMNWNSLTRGPMGIPGIPFPKIFGLEFSSYTLYYYLVLIFAAIVVLLIYRMYNSRIGRAFIALREDETGAASMGCKYIRLQGLGIYPRMFLCRYCRFAVCTFCTLYFCRPVCNKRIVRNTDYGCTRRNRFYYRSNCRCCNPDDFSGTVQVS